MVERRPARVAEAGATLVRLAGIVRQQHEGVGRRPIQRVELDVALQPDVAALLGKRPALGQAVADDLEQVVGLALVLVEVVARRDRSVRAHRERLVEHDHAGVMDEELGGIEVRVRERRAAVPEQARVQERRSIEVALVVLVAVTVRAGREPVEVRVLARVEPDVVATGAVAAAGRGRLAVLTDTVSAPPAAPAEELPTAA